MQRKTKHTKTKELKKSSSINKIHDGKGFKDQQDFDNNAT